MVYPIKFAIFPDQSGAQPQQPQNMPQPPHSHTLLHSHACPIAAAARSTCNHAERAPDCGICQAFTHIEAAQDGWLQTLCICERHNPDPRLDTPAGRHKLEEKVKETGDRELITLSWARGTIRSLAQIIDDNFERVLHARVAGRNSITKDDVRVINEAGQLMERIMPHIHDTNGNFWIDDKKLLIPVQDFGAPPLLERQRHPAADDRHFRESREAWLAFEDFERRVDNDLVFMDREQCYISDLLPKEERERIALEHGQNQQQYLNQRYAEAQRLTRESMVEDELLEPELVVQQHHARPLVVNGSTPNPVATPTTVPRPSTREQKQETRPQPTVSMLAPRQIPTTQQPNVKQARTGPPPPPPPQHPQQKAQQQPARPRVPGPVLVPVPPPPPVRESVTATNPNPAPRPVTLSVRPPPPPPPPPAQPVANAPGLKRKASGSAATTPGTQTREQQEARLRAARAAVPTFYDPQTVMFGRSTMNEPKVAEPLAQQQANQGQAQQANHRSCVQGIVSELDVLQALQQRPVLTLPQQGAEQKQDHPLVVNGSAAPKRAVVGTRGGKKQQQQSQQQSQQRSQPRANTSPHRDSAAARTTEQMNGDQVHLDQETLRQREAADEKQVMDQVRREQECLAQLEQEYLSTNSPTADPAPNPAAVRAIQNQQLRQQLGVTPSKPQELQPVLDEMIVPELYWSRLLIQAQDPQLSSTTTKDTASSTKPAPVEKEAEDEEAVAAPKAPDATDVKMEPEDDAPKPEDKDKTEKQPEPEQQEQPSTSGHSADSPVDDLLQEQQEQQQRWQQPRDPQTCDRFLDFACESPAPSLDVDMGFVLAEAEELKSVGLRSSASSPENGWMEVVMEKDG